MLIILTFVIVNLLLIAVLIFLKWGKLFSIFSWILVNALLVVLMGLLLYPTYARLFQKATRLMYPKVIWQKWVGSTEKEIYEQDGYRVWVYSQAGNLWPTRKNKTIEFGKKVELFAVIEKDGQLYTDNALMIRKKEAKPLADLGEKLYFEWYKLEPEYHYYITKSGFQQIYGYSPDSDSEIARYFRRLEMNKMRFMSTYFAKGSKAAIDQESEANHSLKWKGQTVGTMRYQLRANIGGREICSYGKRYLESDNLAKMDKVHRISVKGDTGSDILDMGFALGNLPYYWGSYKQSLGYYGSDCAKFVSVAYYQAGQNIGYKGTAQFNEQPHRYQITGINSKGQLVAKNQVLEYGRDIKVGDVILRRSSRSGHAALVGEDKNKDGILDVSDYILHTSWAAPHYERIANTTFGRNKTYQKSKVKIVDVDKL